MESLDKNFGYFVGLTATYYKLAAISILKNYGNIDITPEQYGILLILHHEDGMYQRQISQILMKDRPNMTRMVNVLEQKGYITRKKDPENKRVLKLYLTDLSRDLVKKVGHFKDTLDKKSTKGIAENELEICLSTLAKIRANLDDSFNIQL